VKLGQPVAGGVGDVGPLVQAGPDAHHAVLARAGDPPLAVQVGDVGELAPGERMGGGHGDEQAALGEGPQAQWRRFGVGRAERRRRGQQREVQRARAQRADQRRGAALARGHATTGCA
jgi:hypothetical protein